MKGFGWNWTKSEYPMIIIWIIFVFYIFFDQLFRNQLYIHEETWNNYSLVVLFSFIILAIISLFLYYSKDEKISKDERTKKVNYKAKNYSWNATYFFVIVILVIAEIFNITNLQAAALIILSMILSQFIFVIYFNKKGIVD